MKDDGGRIPDDWPRVSPENQQAFAEFWGDDFQTMRFSAQKLG
jgi:hypothetical protein